MWTAATMVNNENYFNKKIINIENNLHPWFVTGYSDGESSFSIRVRSNSLNKFGFNVSIVYSIGAQINPENYKLLELLKNYFNKEGSISKSGYMYIYEVSTIKGLKVIRNHFNNYPLQSTKMIYFQLWCKVLDLIENKKDLTMESYLKILSIKSVFPKGLSDKIRNFYPHIDHFVKPKFKLEYKPLDPYWISGYVQVDGTFGLNYTKVPRMILGYTCQPQFRFTQHKRDFFVLSKIIKELGCGNIIKPSIDRDEYNISVGNLKDLREIIIPFFNNYPLYGSKLLYSEDFKKGINIIKYKGHLNLNGLNELKSLIYSMNTYRKYM